MEGAVPGSFLYLSHQTQMCQITGEKKVRQKERKKPLLRGSE